MDSKPFARHFWPFFSMAMASDGWVVTGGGDGALRRWDLLERREIGEPITADSRWVLAVAVTPDGRNIVSGGGDGVVRLWDVETGRLIEEVPSHTSLIWAVRVSSDGMRVISGGDDGTVSAWNLRSGEVTTTRTEGSVRAVIADESGVIWSGTDGIIRLSGQRAALTGHVGWVQALALTPEETELVSGGSDGTIRRWDLRTGLAIGEPMLGHDGTVFTVAVTPDGKRIVSGGSDGTVRYWDLADGAASPLFGHTDWVRSVLVSVGGDRVISCGNDGTIGLASVSRGSNFTEYFQGPAVAVNALAVHQETGTVFSASIDGSVRRWDARTGRAHGRLRAPDGWVNALALSPDGKVLVRAGEDGAIVRWDAVTGNPTDGSLIGHEGGVRAVAFTPDSRRMVSVGADGTVRRWDRDSGEPIGSPLTGHRGAINSVVVTPDGRQIITAGSDDGALIRWDAETGNRLGKPITAPSRGVLTVAVDPAGRRIVSGGSDGRTRVWNAGTGEPLTSPKERHKGSVTVVRFSPDGRRIYSGGTDQVVRQWDAETGASAGAPLRGHDGTITSLAFLDDTGAVLLSGSADGTVRKWDLASGTQLAAETVRPAVLVETLADVQSDLESSIDQLDIADDVRRIGAMLAAVAVRPPLSVALLGDWGTGKSTFMRQLRAWLEDTANKARAHPGSAYVSNLKQVTFNAWHYSDDHLWVGLVEHMFRELANDDLAQAPDKAAEREAAADEVAELKAKLSTRKADRERLAADLGAIDRIGADRGWFAAARAPLRSARVARAALRSTWRELRGPRGWLVVFAAVAGAAGVVFGVRFGQAQLTWISAVIAGVAGVATPLVTAWHRLAESTENVRKQLLRRKNELDADIENADDALARVDPAHRLHRLLAEISTAERYENFRGLTGRIHHDLRRLSEDLAKIRVTWRDRGEEGRPPLQRVVLYVDDLDRCRPGRVADVLQAVNLLLTMDLFMVVVAVDPRWLLNALNQHHSGLLADTVTPLDYLDKIFHIPFALRPMGVRAANYLRSMLPVDDESEEEPAPAVDIPQPFTPEAGAVVERTPTNVHHGTAEATPHHPLQEAALSVADVAAEGLRIRSFEQDFLARVAVLLPTPRAVKKLANLYRLVRLSVPSERLERFLSEGEYQAPALLLATLVGDPHRARSLLIRLSTAVSEPDITAVLKAGGVDCRLSAWIEALRREGTDVRGDTATYRMWATVVARYGFETYDLFADQES
ncbi:P-loop NTPase fold protein [Amycolatopsis sp. NBRC 101858]|uniref:P-loop NTPase fold protein n=1 Tax=Amycolatopsis sp. NBRC 101858 TaxID=3032200 RepID=UPI0025563227|nr:P-loop NTPase fold protein [Amycolatopsis sp. NBRC 101858]